MFKTIGAACLVAISLFLLPSSQAQAQATRTWVSGVGDDVNPCSRTAPCKTFAGAISKTAPGGEINVLDPGGFGAVTITKSISIVSHFEAGVLVSGTNGIVISGAGVVVHLEGLEIEGLGTGLVGVNILNAKDVFIKNCVIRGFRAGTAAGINVGSTDPNTRVFVTDTVISSNIKGVFAKPTSPGAARVVLERTQVVHNTGAAIHSEKASAGGTTIGLSNSDISYNALAFERINGGVIQSLGNNTVLFNDVMGSPLDPVSPM